MNKYLKVSLTLATIASGSALLIGLVNLKENSYEINKEWNVNVAVQNGYRYGYFAYGFGLQLLNPYAYIGFASEHFVL